MDNFCQLSFGRLVFHSENISEVIVNAGVELTLDEIEEFHRALIDRHKAHPFGAIINRINDYSYSFEAQLKIGDLDNLKAVAAIYYSSIGKLSSETVQDIKKSAFNMKLFDNYEMGLDWLRTQLDER